MTTVVETETTISLTEAASRAWEMKAKLDSDAAVQSFRNQLQAKLKQRRDDYVIDPVYFDDQAEPSRQVGARIDGLEFALGEQRELVVITWRCEEKGCKFRQYAPVKDLVTLGRALALGEQHQIERPKCEQHTKR